MLYATESFVSGDNFADAFDGFVEPYQIFGPMYVQEESGRWNPNYASGGEVMGPSGAESELLEIAMAVSDPQYPNREAIISMGLEKYGPDLISQIAALLGGGASKPLPPPSEDVLQKSTTYEFSSGGYVPGIHGGMDDTIPAVTDGSQPAKLSSGEFVVPADVVSGLGDGNNQNGAQKLYDMMDRIRAFKTGDTQQPPPILDSEVLPG